MQKTPEEYLRDPENFPRHFITNVIHEHAHLFPRTGAHLRRQWFGWLAEYPHSSVHAFHDFYDKLRQHSIQKAWYPFSGEMPTLPDTPLFSQEEAEVLRESHAQTLSILFWGLCNPLFYRIQEWAVDNYFDPEGIVGSYAMEMVMRFAQKDQGLQWSNVPPTTLAIFIAIHAICRMLAPNLEPQITLKPAVLKELELEDLGADYLYENYRMIKREQLEITLVRKAR